MDIDEDARIQNAISLDDVDAQGIEYSDAQKSILADLDRQKALKQLAVPTVDREVRLTLRKLGEPITLFAESLYERRERLRILLFKYREEHGTDAIDLDGDVTREGANIGDASGSMDIDEEASDEEFFTAGGTLLQETRKWIAAYSLPRARQRVEAQRRAVAELNTLQYKQDRRALYNTFKKFSIVATQVGAARPLSCCTFTADDSRLITGGWDGSLRAWEVPSCEIKFQYAGHQDKIIDVKCSTQPNALALASSCIDGSIGLWSEDCAQIQASLRRHEGRVNKIAFHPSGKYLGSAGADATWRFWDLNTAQELLSQEGHVDDVFSISFNDDGSLVCSGGKDAYARLWDLRSGRLIAPIEGHIGSILSIDWSPNGYTIATGSEDGTVRLHDIRHLKTNLYKIPAHSSSVTSVKFHRVSADRPVCLDGNETYTIKDRAYHGDFLLTGGYDGTCKVWGSEDWKMVKSLQCGDDGEKVMSLDVTNNMRYIATSSYDKTFKIWANEDAIN